MNIVSAKDLRNTEILRKISGDKPGWYRWWASTETLKCLLDSPHITKKHMKQLLPHLSRCTYEQDDYFCIYVGVAIKESIRDRLNWHVNQRHTKSAVQSGFLSTFRKSVSSLLAGNQYDENATNNLIDNMMIEYCEIDHPIKSESAKDLIQQIENNEMKEHIMPLNIMGNRHTIVQSFISDLKRVRKLSTQSK